MCTDRRMKPPLTGKSYQTVVLFTTIISLNSNVISQSDSVYLPINKSLRNSHVHLTFFLCALFHNLPRLLHSIALGIADNSWHYRGWSIERPVILKSKRFTYIKSLLLRASLTDGQTINIELISSWRGDIVIYYHVDIHRKLFLAQPVRGRSRY